MVKDYLAHQFVSLIFSQLPARNSKKSFTKATFGVQPSGSCSLKYSALVGTFVLVPSFREAGRIRRDNKVRSGCATCKQRKVKCDETKPECLRCTRVGKTRSGYEGEPQPWSLEPQTTDRNPNSELISNASTNRYLNTTESANKSPLMQDGCKMEPVD